MRDILGIDTSMLIYLFRIILAGLCGCLVGYERTSRNKFAGIRTYAIVSLSAALMMVISKYGFQDVEKFDATRIAAQIVSGVGFLGAGMIFVKDKMIVHGLTTAAGIWGMAGVGMAIGSGMYFIGIASSIFMILLQYFLHKYSFVTKDLNFISLEIRSKKNIDLKKVIDDNSLVIQTYTIEKKEHEIKYRLVINVNNKDEKEKLVGYLTNNDEIKSFKINNC